MSDEIKKPEEITDAHLPAKELSPEELKQVSGGANDIFAKLGDIKGESIDDKHKDEIEVLSYNFGVTGRNPSSK
jgi:bacteriocin-like protein